MFPPQGNDGNDGGNDGVYNQKMRYISYLFYDIMRRNMAWSQMWLTGSVRTKVGLSDSA